MWWVTHQHRPTPFFHVHKLRFDVACARSQLSAARPGAWTTRGRDVQINTVRCSVPFLIMIPEFISSQWRYTFRQERVVWRANSRVLRGAVWRLWPGAGSWWPRQVARRSRRVQRAAAALTASGSPAVINTQRTALSCERVSAQHVLMLVMLLVLNIVWYC